MKSNLKNSHPKLKIALIADTFPPHRTASSNQLGELSLEFARQGHSVTVLIPESAQKERWCLENLGEVKVLRLSALKTKDVGYIRRTFGEISMPFYMIINFRKSPQFSETWNGIVWYSPSIFHGLFVWYLKKRSHCKGYLIVRDIFPEWAVDLGLMKRGLPYFFFKLVEFFQYSVADIIGVQTLSNSYYFDKWAKKPNRKLEVLQNWLKNPAKKRSTLDISATTLAGRKIFIYAGNMGRAQGLDILLDLAEHFGAQKDIGFLFIGRGNDAARLKRVACNKKLENVLFHDEIDPDEIPNLYSQCTVGIVCLDPRHKLDNIPGKFLTYMQSGLPVLANTNNGNDLATIIRDNEVGEVCENGDVDELALLAEKLLRSLDYKSDHMKSNCCNLFKSQFRVEKTIDQIVTALTIS